jgi:cell wall assembly regulator SMI1
LDAGTFEGVQSVRALGIQPQWWDAKWIPITYDGAGNHHCLDLNPTAHGASGQIITMWHDMPERELVASSFHSWLAVYIDGLEAGQYVYSAEYAGIVEVRDA